MMLPTMKNIVPITDLQRQAGQIIGGLSDSDEPVIVTQRGRAAAVIISTGRYEEIEEDLKRLDELELAFMVEDALVDISTGNLVNHNEVIDKISRRNIN